MTNLDPATAATRACFLLHVRPDRLDDYLRAHTAVWPEMLDALHDCGWRNYSLFLREDDGLVVGYFESDDPVGSFAAMDDRDVNTRWQQTMAPYFSDAPGTGAAGPERLSLYFHLG